MILRILYVEGEKMAERSNEVKSIVKALGILELLDKESELGIGEISERLDLDKSTVHRLVSTLKNAGYIIQNASNKKYSNSFKLFEMGNSVVEKLGLRRIAQPYLEQISRITNETTNIAIIYDAHVIYIDRIESPATIKVDLRIGKRLPIYCTGLGKVMLAYMPQQKVEEILENVKFVKYTKSTVENIEKLYVQIKKIREQGYCIDDEEYFEGLKCVAAPIINYKGDVIAAISIAVPKYRFDEVEKNIDFGSILKVTAYNLSKEFGYIDK